MTEHAYVLRRYKDGVEVPYDAEDEGVADVLDEIRFKIKQVMGEAVLFGISYHVAPNGYMLMMFADNFPKDRLPSKKPLPEMIIDGYKYNFELDGAQKLDTLCLAVTNHKLNRCREYMCVDQYCANYCAALDEHLFMPAGSTFFIRHSNPTEESIAAFRPVTISDPIDIKDVHNNILCTDIRAVPITKDEYLIEVPKPTDLAQCGGNIKIGEDNFEIMPCPSDASQLDMHLAHMSTIDTRYVLRFGLEVKYMFDKKPESMGFEDHPESETDSDDENSYVESALMPGLRKLDFGREIPVTNALQKLTLPEATEQRMKKILAS